MRAMVIGMVSAAVFSLMTGWSGMTHASPVGMEWETTRQIDLTAQPLDIATTEDGEWIFILAPGEVLVYNISENKVTNRIPVDQGFDRMTHTPGNNTLVLTNSTTKALRIVQLEVVHDIALSGLPFMGHEAAPVTVAVFSDYQ